MAFPDENTAAHQICQYLAECGPATARQIREVTGHSASTVQRAFHGGYVAREMSDSLNEGFVYSVSDHMSMSMGSGKRHKGEIVPPRNVNVFTPPLRGYADRLTANLRQPIRDMSFFRTGSQCLPRQ